MRYYTDGLDNLIRVDTDAPRGSQEFFFARAEILDTDGTWYPQSHLTSEILDSGYYRSATADEVGRIISATIPTPAALMRQLVFTRTFSSTEAIKLEDSLVGSAPRLSA
jgi:hypothetical protein